MRLSSRPARRPRRARARALARALALAPLPLLAPLGAARAQAPVCEPPNTLLLLDRSGSMLEGDKWGQALRALSGAFAPNLDRVRLGVLAFPWRRGEEQACGVPAEGLRVPLGEATPERLVALGADALPVDEALTPLAAAIDQGRAQLMALDDGRKKVLVLLTDGVETCADGGQPGSTAPQEAARGAAEDDIDVYAIGLGSLVSRATLRAVAEVGGTGRERLATDEESLRATLEEIIDGANVEVCDGFDNDCDGRVDEGTEGVCASGCHEGVLLCQEGELSVCTAPAVSAERCNQVDDDCDGRVDELNPCAAGATCGDGRCLLPCPPDGCPGGGMCGEDGYCEGGALDAPGGSGAPAGGAPGGAGES
ncbi:MAG: VWA domain-containing protein, partial [Deltaproteobacteria bacterium]|nr:VWA domain-containing protein [Deltaproteobacteria bacterium]